MKDAEKQTATAIALPIAAQDGGKGCVKNTFTRPVQVDICHKCLSSRTKYAIHKRGPTHTTHEVLVTRSLHRRDLKATSAKPRSAFLGWTSNYGGENQVRGAVIVPRTIPSIPWDYIIVQCTHSHLVTCHENDITQLQWVIHDDTDHYFTTPSPGETWVYS